MLRISTLAELKILIDSKKRGKLLILYDKSIEVEHFIDFLVEKRDVSVKQKRSEELRAFAEKFGGTELDLDEELEAAAVEHLLETTEYR